MLTRAVRSILGSGLYLVVFDMLFASSNALMDVRQYSMFGGFDAGLIGFLLTIFWKGTGEVVGGLVNVGLGGLTCFVLTSTASPSAYALDVLFAFMVALPFVVGPRCTSFAAGTRWRIGLVTHQLYRPDEWQDANEAATPYHVLRNRL